MGLGRAGRLAVVLTAIAVPLVVHGNLYKMASLMESQRVQAHWDCVERTISWTHKVPTAQQNAVCQQEGDAAAQEARKFSYIGALLGVLTALFLIWGVGTLVVRTGRWVINGKSEDGQSNQSNRSKAS